MSNKIWFKRKSYGWGWTPSTIEGWIATVLYIVGTLAYPVAAKYEVVSFSPVVFANITLSLLIAFIFLCYKKGEPPEWRWGDKK